VSGSEWTSLWRERPARFAWLGRRAYEPVHELQRRLVAARMAGEIGDVVLLVEHDPVVTLGRGAVESNVLVSEEVLAARGASLARTGRGGDVTYHGPGQLVGYPIVDLKPDRCDVRRYVRSLAEVMILLARAEGVEAGVVDGKIGIWADAEKPGEWAGEAWAGRIAKVGAIGVRISRWITMHGFALNVAPALEHFGWIVPCGIQEHPVTSIDALVGRSTAVRDVALGAQGAFVRAMGLRGEIEDLERADDPEKKLIGA